MCGEVGDELLVHQADHYPACLGAVNSLLLLEAVDERNQYSGFFLFGGIDAVEEFLYGYGGQRVCRGISLSGEIFF